MSTFTQTAAGAVAKARTLPQQPLHVAQLTDALLRLRTVQSVTGLGRSSIYGKVNDGTFPPPVKLGVRCTRWRSADITAWLRAQGREA
jgi:prophage regulatory protein